MFRRPVHGLFGRALKEKNKKRLAIECKSTVSLGRRLSSTKTSNVTMTVLATR